MGNSFASPKGGSNLTIAVAENKITNALRMASAA
jgi:hypothetical protein